jgi:HlyD family secretion protein
MSDNDPNTMVRHDGAYSRRVLADQLERRPANTRSPASRPLPPGQAGRRLGLAAKKIDPLEFVGQPLKAYDVARANYRRGAMILAAYGVLAMLTASAGCAPPAAEAKRESNTMRLSAVEPRRMTIVRTVRQPGQIEAFREAPLYAKVPGYVRRFLVDIGDRIKGPSYDKEGRLVERGQLLAELSIPELGEELAQKRAAVEQAKAEVAQAQAAVKVVRAAVSPAEQQYEQALANEDRATSDYSKWESEFDRVVKLAEIKAINSKLVDEERDQLKISKAGLRDARSRKQAASAMIEQAQAAVEKAQADEVAAEARQRVAHADEARISALVDYQRIEAPFDGVISQRNLDVGHFVQPAAAAQARPLYTVVQTDVVRVFVDVPEAEAAFVDRDDAAVLRVPALGEQEFTGGVTRTSWVLNAATRTLRTEVDVPNPGGALRPGMYVYATIVLERHQDVLTLPLSAVRTSEGESTCFIFKEGKLAATSISLGISDGKQIEVTSGLTGDEVVVEKAAANLTEGQSAEAATAAQ